MFSRFHTIPACYGQTDGQTELLYQYSASVFWRAIKMAEEIDFESWRISNFKGLVTLTLTLDRVIRHTVVHHSSTSTYIPNFIGIGKTFRGRTSDPGRLLGVNLKMMMHCLVFRSALPRSKPSLHALASSAFITPRPPSPRLFCLAKLSRLHHWNHLLSVCSVQQGAVANGLSCRECRKCLRVRACICALAGAKVWTLTSNCLTEHHFAVTKCAYLTFHWPNETTEYFLGWQENW